MSTVQTYGISTLELVNTIGQYYTLMLVELSTCVHFALTFHISVPKENRFHQTQNSTPPKYGVLDIPTPYLVNIIEYVVVL